MTTEYIYENGEIVGAYGVSYATEKAVEALFETVRTLACLMDEIAKWGEIHARNNGWESASRAYEGIGRRIADLIAEELTWPEDKEVVDAFGEPA